MDQLADRHALRRAGRRKAPETVVVMAVDGGSIYAERGPRRQRERHGRALQAALRGSAGLAALLATCVAVVAGTGWLYLLRDFHGLAFGPRLDGALPLQQLAGGSAQPLPRMIVAWLPAGLALGAALRALTRLRLPARAAFTVVGGAFLLLAASAISDAVAENDPLSGHISAAFSRGGVWLAVALLGTGVLIAPPWSARPPGGAVAATST
jgi:hypothetical protein